ncbi:universal stress protein MSMEG_3950/MSMEI_3859-like [Hydractinia symbiolongicarpus]|uniref:universal stress protein MSMEG_3950/MSMEI_3859-like n=1 Tax=Hydractinia symbiolongicarpus TaxID=13093 RepID=UPI002551B1A1|nr:universal stress protein MSMEG_3950/MSMEI_3859-like [Hydractinia symbiolongicarpus]
MSSNKLNLVCVDGSEHSDRAFSWYCKTLHREGDTVGLVHIQQIPYMPIGLFEDGLLIDSACQTAIEENIAASKDVVEKYKSLCSEKQLKAVPFLQVCDDSVGYTICKIAKENSADAIVIGQRGLGTIRRTLLGSVSDYVLHHSHIPTVVIPKEEK